MKDTLGEFAKQDLDIVGAGYSLSDAKKNISYQEVNGVTIATLGFTDVSGKGFAAKRIRRACRPQILKSLFL